MRAILHHSKREGLAGALLVIAIGLLALGLFVIALLAAEPLGATAALVPLFSPLVG